jgi:hypothetical protein
MQSVFHKDVRSPAEAQRRRGLNEKSKTGDHYPDSFPVTPAEAGVQVLHGKLIKNYRIPVSTGMTEPKRKSIK